MAKEEVGPLPDAVPKKRTQIKQIADVHLATWLAGDTITPLERKKLTAEKERRKTLKPDVILGVVCCDEGATPEQLRTLREVLPRIEPTEVHQHPLPGKVNFIVKSLGVPVTVWKVNGPRAEKTMEVVRQCSVLVALPKETGEYLPSAGGEIPSAIKLAKHRSTPVRIILPDGEEVRQ